MKKFALVVAVISSTIVSVPSFAQNGTQLLDLLKSRSFKNLEAATKQIQTKFENGKLSEIALRNTYRQFYDLDQSTLSKVQEWKDKYPTSYAAYLVNGTCFKRMGLDARGTKYISETPYENIDKMNYYHKIARAELNTSLKLTKKPYLSIFHLLDIAESEGNKETALELLASANKMLPSNTLVRNRFMHSLTPRWGGSYKEMNDFITRAKKERVSANGLMQLEAIMYDDMGKSADEAGNSSAAVGYIRKSLELGKRVGGEFRKDFLKFSNYYSCSCPDLKQYCQ